MAAAPVAAFPRRIYPLDTHALTEEQLAVVFAMTSRRPEPFDAIATMVTQEKAADFHERWVLNYGHASVAEHAILHMAVENISRLACDTLEDNRLASYTEKSSRYQVLERGYYHIPEELEPHPRLKRLYVETCDLLFDTYHQLVEASRAYLGRTVPPKEGERESAYSLRLRRVATDSCRFVLPAATLTNVGMTLNARSLEHAIQKLLSSEMEEERQIGQELREKGKQITPTLIKYADRSPYLVETRKAQKRLSSRPTVAAGSPAREATLVHFDPLAEHKVAAAFLYRWARESYAEVWQRVQRMSDEERRGVVQEALGRLGPFDAPVREAEYAEYTFDLVLDYGAYREFKRHRMQSYVSQPLTVHLGYVTPPLIQEAGLQDVFDQAVAAAERAYHQIEEMDPVLAQYVATHAHQRRVLARMNLRECYHLLKLRTSPQTHFSLRMVMEKLLELCAEVHPALFSYLKRRTD